MAFQVQTAGKHLLWWLHRIMRQEILIKGIDLDIGGTWTVTETYQLIVVSVLQSMDQH